MPHSNYQPYRAHDGSGQKIRLALVSQLIEVIDELRRRGYQVVLISSGAVGMGCIKLGIPKPTSLRTKQAVAAAGQSQLMRMYEDLFGTVRIHVAQLLLSQSDFMQKEHWANVKNTIMECLALGVVPIINENDSTNTAELRFGDNDNLAALTAVQLEADALCHP
ncbi:Glutamate 5-kinase, partial [Symbiodinium microadriaticum]